MVFPKSYKLKWRLLNSLIKFIEILNKDLDPQALEETLTEIARLSGDPDAALSLLERRELARNVASRWSPKAILGELGNLHAAWDDGRTALDAELGRLVNLVSLLGTLIKQYCAADVVQAYEIIVSKYNDERVEGCDPSKLTDKQFIKALNSLRARKDTLLAV